MMAQFLFQIDALFSPSRGGGELQLGQGVDWAFQLLIIITSTNPIPKAMVVVMMVNLDILQCDCGRRRRSWTPGSGWIG